MIKTILLIFIPVVLFSQTTITIDASAPAKQINYIIHNGYHHKEFMYEVKPALKRIHEINTECKHKRLPIEYVRTQNLLTSLPTNSRTQQISGRVYENGQYNFTRMYSVYDELTGSGINPIVEFNYMPVELAEDTTEIGGWGLSCISPPGTWPAWESLISNTFTAIKNRYDTNGWYFGVWNEPDHPQFFNFDRWGFGKFIEMYQHAANQVNSIKIGGPDCAGVHSWTRDFIQDCRNDNTKLDYISVHGYMANVRYVCYQGWHMVNDYLDVNGITPQNGQVNDTGIDFLVTECAPHSDSYNQPFVQNRYAAVWWLAMVDIFLEAADIYGDAYLPNVLLYCGIMKPLGYRSLMVQTDNNPESTEILKTPLFNTFEMLSMLSAERLPVTGCGFSSNMLNVKNYDFINFNQVRCIATRTPGESVEILVYHFNHNNRLVYNKKDNGDNPAYKYGTYYHSQPDAIPIRLEIANIHFQSVKVECYVIDRNYSNTFSAYVDGGWNSDYNYLNGKDDLSIVDEYTTVLSNNEFNRDIVIQNNSAMLFVITNNSMDITAPDTVRNVQIEEVEN